MYLIYFVFQEEQFLFYWVNKNFNVSVFLEYFFCELMLLVLVLLDSDDEEVFVYNEEEIVNFFKVILKDKDIFLFSLKSKILKYFINFVGLRFKWFFFDYLLLNI